MSTTVYSSPTGLQLQASNGLLALSGQTVGVSGATSFSNPVTLASTLSVSGATSLTAPLTAQSLTVSNATVSSTLNANSLAGASLSIAGNASVNGTSTCNALSAQSAQVSGLVSGGSLTAGSSTLGSTTLSTCTVNGSAVVSGLASMSGGIAVTGGSSLQAVNVAGALTVLSPATFSSSSPQVLQVVGTSTQASAYSEVVIDRSAAGQNNVGSVRFVPSTGLQLTTNAAKSLTVSSVDQQVSVTANRSGQTFAVRGDGQISAATEILLDNSAKASGQTGIIGVDTSGLYLSSASASKALTIAASGNVSFSGNALVPGTFQAAGASTFSSLNASSLSTASLSASAVSASRITGQGVLALQGGDASQTVSVTNVLQVNNVQAKPGAALALSGQDSGLTTQIVGTLKVDNIGKRSGSMVSIVDPLAVLTSMTSPIITINGNPGSNQLSIINTDSTANSDAAVTLNRSAFNSAYTGSMGLRPNVGYFVQLGNALAFSIDAISRAAALAGALNVAGAISGSGALSIAGNISGGGSFACTGSGAVAGGLNVGGAVQLMSGSSPISILSADSNFCYLRYIDSSGVIADRFKVDRNGNFSMNGQLTVGGSLACGSLSCSSFATTSSNNTPSASLVGLNTTMAQLAADSSYMRLRYFDSNNTLQDRLLLDRSGNLAIMSNLSIPGSCTAASLSLSGALSTGGASTLTGAVSMLGSVAITGSAPYAITFGPSSGAYASLAATSSTCTLSASDGTTLQPRLTIAQNGQVSVNTLSIAGALTCAGGLSSGNISIASTQPTVTLGSYGRVVCDNQFMHLQQWDGTNPPADRLTISTTGLVSVPNAIVTSTFTIGNDAGAALQLKNSSGTSWGSVYADSSSLRLRSSDANANLQDRILVNQSGTVTVPGAMSVTGAVSTSAGMTVVSGTTAGAGAAYSLQAGSTVSSAVYSEQGFMALQVQNSSGTLVNRATLDSFGNVKLLGATAVSGAVACQGNVTVSSSAPAVLLNNGASSPYAQLSATSGQVLLSVSNGQGQLQNGIAWDTSANMVCPGSLTIGNVSASRLTSSGPVQGASTLTLTDPTNGGFGASILHTGANATPQIVMSLADNTGAYSPQMTITSGQVSMASLNLTSALTVGGNAACNGSMTVSGSLTTTAAFRASSQMSLYADPSLNTANLYMTNSNGSTVNTQILSTATYASFLQTTSGTGLTERMRFDNAQNILFNASLLPNTTGLTIGTSASKWNQIWSVNTPNTTSDARLKKDIEDLPGDAALHLIKSLKPKSFRWKDQEFGSQKNWGFIAQDVRELVGPDDGLVGENGGEYSLRYTDLIAPLVSAVQQLLERM